MGWFTNLVQMGLSGYASPLATLIGQVQLSRLEERVNALEDPFSQLHPDVAEFSRIIHSSFITRRAGKEPLYRVPITIEDLERFDVVLRVLENRGVISITRDCRAHGPKPTDFLLLGNLFCLYIFELYGPKIQIGNVMQYLENHERGVTYDGESLAQDFEVPIEFVDSVFATLHAGGLGLKSDEVGEVDFV